MSSRIRIVHLLLSLETGGMETFVAGLVRKQAAQMDLSLLCTDSLGPFGEELAAEGIAVELFTRNHPTEPFVSRLAERIRDAQVLHSHSGLYHPAARAARTARVPVHVTTDHGRFDPDPLKIRVGDFLHLPWVDAVVAVSGELAEYLRRRVHIPQRKLRTIINGVDTDRFSPQADDGARQRLRKEWQVSDDTLVVGSVGRQAEVKDYPTLIRGLATAAAGGTPVTGVLAGDGPELQKNQELAEQLQAPVLFLGAREDVPDLLRAFDLFALTSRSEGTSMAILEAQATALPVFATPVGGNPHLVHDETHGRLLSVDEPERWAEAFRAAATDPPLLRRYGDAARARVTAEFSLERAASDYAVLYNELLAAKGVVVA